MIEQSIDGSVRLFGLPHQFTQYTDYRISDKTNLGRVFAETFVLDAPRVFLKPGTSNFLPGMSEAERKGFMQAIKDLADNDSSATSLKQKLDQGMFGDKNVKYFEFEQRFDKYMSRVNLLCRVGAVFMDVNKVKVPWDRGSTVTFGNYDWRHYKFKSTFTGVSNVGKNPESALNGFDISSFLSSIALDDSYVEFYVDASASYSESASNSTTQSMLTSFTDSLSSVGKELAFISGATGVAIDNLAMSTSDSVENAISSIAKGDSAMANLLRRLTGTSNQLISGGNFIVSVLSYVLQFILIILSFSVFIHIALINMFGTENGTVVMWDAIFLTITFFSIFSYLADLYDDVIPLIKRKKKKVKEENL
jgi:hypothetical protein